MGEPLYISCLFDNIDRSPLDFGINTEKVFADDAEKDHLASA